MECSQKRAKSLEITTAKSEQDKLGAKTSHLEDA